MRRSTRATLVITFAAMLIVMHCFAGAGEAQPQTQPARAPDAAVDAAGKDFVFSEMRVQTFPPRTYLYTTRQTTIRQIGEAVGDAMPKLMETIANEDVQIMGSPVFVYVGATNDMDKPFELQIGFPVEEGTDVAGDQVQVRELEEFRAATVLYSGSMQHIGQAYEKVYGELFKAGLQPTGTNREMHLYFEDPASPNNILQIQVGVK